ncbi:hypothetical protein A3A39_04840 [Candidatus Kaiserbacteria bacterium RIFCSPLOWO2_01_FULL_54_13]|uniref:DUF4430 domain-containing protein n=1 Tax=Candidatus Kaiserbacteria bacterium RIFCSPLOWO2_01_FULL_54_13 TaxID=1798512 RepID=A0A1F6F0V6_9BACT|nr:MAG: hypothetical protein A3A39_04840 [Candidatus Kaiserbacteria bacterium RIFCSPLOWO2_01_FULL_54_13]
MSCFVRLLSGAVLLFVLVTIPTLTHAQSVEGNIELPDNCTVTDKVGGQHTFPQENSPSEFLAVCALAKALQTGLITDMRLSEFPGFGLFVEGLNGVVAGSDEYWALWLSGAFAECGIECLTLTQGDTISFILTSFEGEERGASIVLHISALTQTSEGNAPAAPSSSSSGGGEYLQGRPFDVSAALNFLADNQNDDGSFASSLLTDWAAIAFGAAEGAGCSDWCQAAHGKLRFYQRSARPELSSATDYERHAMALMALDINPFAETGSDYITPIVDEFDGAQIGDASLVNDDIFALFPLLHAGYAKTDTMIDMIVKFILFKQKTNGSWEGSIDLTAAAIQALALFPARSDAIEAIERAQEFLRRNQNESGIFGTNSFSLSWVLQATRSLGQTPDDWKKSGVTPLGYLGVLQQEDGGVEPMSMRSDTRIWATSYAIPAALAKPWHSILKDFSRPVGTETLSSVSEVVLAPIPSTVSAPITPPKPTPAIVPSQATPSDVEQSGMTAANTTTAQLAAAATPSENEWNSNGIWLAGVALIFSATFYFLFRRA